MIVVASHAVRRADVEVDAFVAEIIDHLQSDGSLVDLSIHDTRGTLIQLRTRSLEAQT
jgi:hypothetical protein